jgi:hypothetical protein
MKILFENNWYEIKVVKIVMGPIEYEEIITSYLGPKDLCEQDDH